MIRLTTNGVLAAVAVWVGIAILMSHEGRPSSAVQELLPDSTFVSGWHEVLRMGHAIGDERGLVSIVAFVDMQCPFCARFVAAMDTVMAWAPGDVRLSIIQFPLPSHRMALPLAVAAECAAKQGRFAEMFRLGLETGKSDEMPEPEVLAAGAGVASGDAFKQCVVDGANGMPAIEDGVETAMRLGVRGTPTVVIDGWLRSGAPTVSEVKARIRDARARM